MRNLIPLRWVVVGVFVLATALSFLDRQVLAAMAPQLRAEFGLSYEQFGWVVSAFSLAYALSAPFSGLLVDRLGLNRGILLSVGLWSIAGMSTGLVGGFGALLACRAALGVAEAGGIPASGKAFALYLLPRERALGGGLNQIGISLGLVASPLISAWLGVHYGWRAPFIATGALGFLWIPLWLRTVRRVPPAGEMAAPPAVASMLGDHRLWGLTVANVFAMTGYSLWTNWTTVFLVTAHGMTQATANRRLAWVPPLFASLGGLAGGWLSSRWAAGGHDLLAARRRVAWMSAAALLLTAVVPLMPTPGLATAAVSWSFFWSLALSVNIYALPLDVFGAHRAAFGVSALTFSYGLMQTFVSPLFGRVIDRAGFAPLCVAAAVLPLAAAVILEGTVRKR